MTDFEDFDDYIDELDAPEFETSNETDPGITEDETMSLTGHSVDDDSLSVSEDDLQSLEDKAAGIDRSEADKSQISFGRKMCPTRGGCQGATDCNYSYGSYPG